jgi:acyl carrier protein
LVIRSACNIAPWSTTDRTGGFVVDTQTIVVNAVRSLLERRSESVEISVDADLYDELGLDSLEVAELSAWLEDELGRDPYTEGELPRTIAQVVDFYKE